MRTINCAPEVIDSDVVSDIYHGREIIDPFRWLEEHLSPRTRAWIEEQAEISRSYLDKLAGREALKPRVAELLDLENIGDLRKFGDLILYAKRRPGEQQARLYRRAGVKGEETVLLDPAVLGEGSFLSLSIVDVSPNGKLLAYGLRSGGQGARRIRILDFVTGETLSDELPKGAVRGFAFLPDSNGFFYAIEVAGKPSEPKTVKRHLFGQPFDRDKIVFYGGRSSNMRLLADFDQSSCAAVYTVVRAVGKQNLISVHLQMLCSCGKPLMTMVEDSQDPWDVRIHGDRLYLLLNQDDGVGRRLISVPLDAPDLTHAETILIEDSLRIQRWSVLGERIITATVENLSSTLRMYSRTGQPLGAIELPEPGTAAVLAGDNGGCFFSFESYTRPREVYYYDFSTGVRELFSSPARRVEMIAVQRTEYSAQDGTRIPLTLLGRDDVLQHHNAPVLLTAYGASGVSLTPQYSSLATCFIQLGGVFALAHVRGGGEFGSIWEDAGKRRNRPNVHEDFLAAADFLTSNGLAGRGRIAAAGGSNSGLLVATALTRQPDRFCAVLCIAPFTDMLRYHRFDNTQFYIPQFGSADDPDDFPILFSYSPYHNVRDGVRYPALLMISGDADTRCDPMHARKFVARLQSAMSTLPLDDCKERPILLDWDPLRGHFATLPLAKRSSAIVDRLAFLCHHLGMEVT